MKYKCYICGDEFFNVKIKANHVRWKHHNNELYRKNISNSKIERDKQRLGDFKLFNVNCNKCGKIVSVKEREKLFPKKDKYFCNKKCSNSRNHSEETKRKISETTSLSIKKKWCDSEYFKIAYKNIGKRRFDSKGEIEVRNYFQIKYPNDEWTFGPCHINGITLVRDCFSKKLKVCIEYDGIWHFKDINGQLKDKQNKDLLLEKWCKENNFRLIRIKEDIYKQNKKLWIDKLEKEVYTGVSEIVKFYDN